MIVEATIQKLHELRLKTMADGYRRQMNDASLRDLSFDERFGLIVDAEWQNRRNNRLSRLISNANFGVNACVEDIEYHADRMLEREQILSYATCRYIAERRNIIILGATGAGKSYLSCALGLSACRNFYTVKYARLPELLNELNVARHMGTYKKTLNAYAKASLLILDEWLLMPLRENDARDVFEVVDSRCGNGSTIFSSQFNTEGWYGRIGEGPLADAILDRILHNSYRILINGESMRKRKAIS